MDNQSIERDLLGTAAGPQWNLIGCNPHRGIVVPLFALHSESSGGIGEYTDLPKIFLWCRGLGFDTIQLLPLNDTGLETSPYSALTANALNPIHLGLMQLPLAMQDYTLKSIWEDLRTFNRTQRISYPDIQQRKELFLRRYHDHYGQVIQALPSYQRFVELNERWLHPFAAFKALKISTQWKNWSDWTESEIDNISDTEIDYHIFVQYLCFDQLQTVKKEANQHGIFLQGDIPILINFESADVWNQRELFITDIVAGAPPDMYAAEGQKWGFPIYNWDALAAQNYAWWINRLRIAELFYDIYRIDHIVGFFRIWGIPISAPSKQGYFIPTDQNKLIPLGNQLMQMMLKNCSMLPIGEDLGTVPPEVRECLKSLGICGTKVMRWERHWHGDGSYIDPKEYPTESMTTVSTHDSETLTLWWMNQTDEARRFAISQGWDYQPKITQDQRSSILSASNHSGSLFHINLLQEYLAMIPELVWENPEDERINIPGTITPFNWSYRFRPSIEEIISNYTLQSKIQSVL